MPSIILMTLGAVLIAVLIHMVASREVRRCPVCESRNIREIDRTTEEIVLNKREIPGIGSKVHVSATVSRRCYSCGHLWQVKEHN